MGRPFRTPLPWSRANPGDSVRFQPRGATNVAMSNACACPNAERLNVSKSSANTSRALFMGLNHIARESDLGAHISQIFPVCFALRRPFGVCGSLTDQDRENARRYVRGLVPTTVPKCTRKTVA